jgi:ubiquinone/menaquinone biosynthesis C-methylase UbiE
MDMMDMQLETSSFDGVISFYSIIHTPKTDAPKIFREFNRILKPKGLVLIVVKKGASEGIINDEWYERHLIYFTNFLKREISDFLTETDFQLVYQETRSPYGNEIDVDRIYTIAKKYR